METTVRSDVPMVRVDSYPDAVHVLRSSSFVQITPESGHGAEWTTLLAHGTVLHVDDEDHFERRRILSKLFRRRTLATYEREVLVPALEGAMRELATERRGGSRIAVDLLRVTREVLASLLARLVGLEGITEAGEREAFLRDFTEYEIGFRAKFVEDPEASVTAALAAKDRILERHFTPAWERRQRAVQEVEAGERGAEELPQDLITTLIEKREHYARWGDDVAWREALLFMVASVGSTANAICHAVADILDWLEAHPDESDAVADPTFLDAAFRDSVRLHQTNVLLRTARTDDTLPSGEHVPEGAVAVIDRDAINRTLEAADGGDQLRFDPRREDTGDAHDYGLAFGEGPHTCIGRTMVLGEYGTSREGSEGQLRGLAVATLRYLFAGGIERIPEDPPTMVPGMDRETWVSFPVVLELQGGEQ